MSNHANAQSSIECFYVKFKLPEMHLKNHTMDCVLGVPGTVINCYLYLGLNVLKEAFKPSLYTMLECTRNTFKKL